ncbi:MAG: Nucleotide-binding protein, PIN protein [archaeon GW2011_AR19]|nr:MAG: Nucleotide-binding protein, PIN protein [archaeon GW2011_AR19]
MNTLVIDTNIFMSGLIKKGLTRKIITNSKINFLFPEFELEEIYNHKKEIIKKAGYSEKEFYVLLLRLLKYVRIIPTDVVVDYKKQAYEIIGNIDEDDVIFIATALAFNCPIWSDDKHFQKQNVVKIFKTSEFFYFIN